jgi:hypothetical protein
MNLSKSKAVLWFFFILCTGGAFFFLHGQGESVAMKNKPETSTLSTPKPPIDSAVPATIETATFALG